MAPTISWPDVRMEEGICISEDLEVDPTKRRVESSTHALDGFSESIHVVQELATFAIGRSVRRVAAGSSVSSTQYPGSHCTSPITAKLAGNRTERSIFAAQG